MKMYLSINSASYMIHRQGIYVDRIKSALGNALWNMLAELRGDAQFIYYMVVPFYIKCHRHNNLDCVLERNVKYIIQILI